MALGLAAITVAGAALRLATIDGVTLWFDEAVTLALVRMDLGEMLARIPDSESTPPLYYLLAWAWGRVAGTGQLASRALPALAGIATIPAAYAAAAALATRRVGLIVAGLAAASPLLVWHAQDARAYSLLVLLCALSVWGFARALDEPSPRRLAVWAGTASLALLSHYFAVFLVLAEAAWLVARRGARRRALGAAGAVVLVGAALVPLAVHQHAHGGAAWLADRALGARVGNAWTHFAAGYGAAPGPLSSYEGGPPPALSIVAAALAVVGIVLAVALLAARRDAADADDPDERRERSALAVGLTLAAAAIGAPLLLAIAGVDYIFTRNLLPGWLALALLAGLGYGARRAGRWGLAGGVALCLALGAVTVVTAATPRFGPYRWEEVTRALAGPKADRVVMAPASTAMPLALERPGLATLPAAGAHGEEIDVLRRGPKARRPPAPGFHLARRRLVGDSFTLFRFRAGRPRLVTPTGLLGDDPVRRHRTAVLFAPALGRLGARERAEAPALFFCGPSPGDARSRLSIRTRCEEAYPAPDRPR